MEYKGVNFGFLKKRKVRKMNNIYLADYSKFDSETVKKLQEINAQIEEEYKKEKVDTDLITKLRFEQLMKGLSLQYMSLF